MAKKEDTIFFFLNFVCCGFSRVVHLLRVHCFAGGIVDSDSWSRLPFPSIGHRDDGVVGAKGDDFALNRGLIFSTCHSRVLSIVRLSIPFS